MVQIYLLSVISSIAGGFLLLADQLKEKVPALSGFREVYNRNQSYQPFIFCLYCLIGVLNLFFPYKGIFFLGDFFPAVSNILIGVALFLEYYMEKGKVVSDSFNRVISFFGQYQGALGSIALISGLAHFIVPGVIFI